MKARLPKEYAGMGQNNLQQLAQKAQKMQEEMQNATQKLEEKEYVASSGGGAVKAVVTGKIELKELEIEPDLIDPENPEMLEDLVIVAVNSAILDAQKEKEEIMEKLSGGIGLPGVF
jgi:DNA-binding YbaB/EbfC family protein